MAVQQLTGRLSKARNVQGNVSDKGQSFRPWDVTSKAAVRTKALGRLDIRQKALAAPSGRSAVLGRYALNKPGDCNVARRQLCGESRNKSQECGDLPSPAFAGHGSYQGISCRQRRSCTTVGDDPKDTWSTAPLSTGPMNQGCSTLFIVVHMA